MRTNIMQNITLSVDERIVKKVRMLALDKDTTLTALVRSYLADLASNYNSEQQLAADRLESTFKKYSRNMGERPWSREDIHERS
jgi:hypothetical protein